VLEHSVSGEKITMKHKPRVGARRERRGRCGAGAAPGAGRPGPACGTRCRATAGRSANPRSAASAAGSSTCPPAPVDPQSKSRPVFI